MNPTASLVTEVPYPVFGGEYTKENITNLLSKVNDESGPDVDTYTVTVWWGTKNSVLTEACRFGRESLCRHCPVWINAIVTGRFATVSLLVEGNNGEKHGFVFEH